MSWYFEHAHWLYTKIYQNEFFFFDLWSIVHCWSGFILYISLKALHAKKPLSILFWILFVYNVLEVLFIYFASNIFEPETIKDQFTDIIMGMLGGIIGFLILRFSSLNKNTKIWKLDLFIIFLASITYAWLWVGFYRYDYNQEFYNSPGINMGAFVFWVLGAFATIWASTLIRLSNIWLKWLVVWAIYLVCLFIVEYFGFVILSLHESSKANAQPLLFGLIHGTPVLHFVYVFSPFFTISIYKGLKALLLKSLNVEKSQLKKTNASKLKNVDLQQITWKSSKL
jgi:hypothetical protein